MTVLKEKFRYFHRLKVRYSEIDGQKIVFNAHYLTYLDVANGEYFQEGLGLALHTIMAEGHFNFVLVKSTLEYKNSARLGDWLEIGCRVSRMGISSFTMEFLITRVGEDTPIVVAEIIYVNYDPEKHRSQQIPEYIRNRIREFEGLQE